MSAGVTATEPLVVRKSRLQIELDRTTTDFVNALAPDLPPLFWSLGIDHLDAITQAPLLEGIVVDAEYGEQTAAVAEQWAERLGLTAHAIVSGAREWSGDALDCAAGMRRVRIWCVVDRAAWDADR